ncbi:PmoA family protein [Dyadobacter chenwenxiniae]|uniref:PmoA family protein n=1 Tax=Dyadobacter chenwenxiniae TaxID=2906456 RepID=A0A9X1PIY7_9BACT|nr:PmoA family protein [Dyadobacter chenwenxiniae]MCF0060318.1 PmoA family protein [Dyadobacter chenwenxiniae]UON86369.1 PmoA family protein [Dyadobacter chenwenxiniae]
MAATAFSVFAAGGLVQAQKVDLVNNEKEKKVEVKIDGKAFTSYFYPGEDVLKKAVLYPVQTAKGTLITRGWPLDPRPGERVDHPHHVGIWLNYEDVNGNDYWNNSNAVDHAKRAYGTIIHTGIKSMKSGKDKGELTVTADWKDKNGVLTLKETTTYHFSGKGDQRIIDRSTTLTAVLDEVAMPDIKDGMFAIRVARELELPSNKPEIFTDASGIATKVPVMNNEGITGNYRNSNGVEGEAVWGKRAIWCNLTGKIKDENISVAMIDHPKNVGYPAYWHARGYGLFAVNPLGMKALSDGKETLNFKLKKGESTTFRYRLVIASEHLKDEAINAMAADYAKTK